MCCHINTTDDFFSNLEHIINVLASFIYKISSNTFIPHRPDNYRDRDFFLHGK